MGQATGAASGDAGTEVRRSERAREGEPEEAGTLSQEWVGQAGQARQVEEGGRSGCSSQTLTAGDFTPVPNGSEYSEQKN